MKWEDRVKFEKWVKTNPQELRHCPFCGRKRLGIGSRGVRYTDDYSVSVRCLSCHGSGGRSVHKEKAIANWNGPAQ